MQPVLKIENNTGQTLGIYLNNSSSKRADVAAGEIITINHLPNADNMTIEAKDSQGTTYLSVSYTRSELRKLDYKVVIPEAAAPLPY